MPNTIVCKTAFPYLVSQSVVLCARRAKLLYQVDLLVSCQWLSFSMVVWLSIGVDATPSTKCGKGSGSLAQDEKLNVYPTIEFAGLTKQLLDCNSVVFADASALCVANRFARVSSWSTLFLY